MQSIIWDINPFDQWGVQLGKKLASELTDAVVGKARTAPPTVAGALARLRQWRGPGR